jgi:hypothetical protein
MVRKHIDSTRRESTARRRGVEIGDHADVALS